MSFPLILFAIASLAIMADSTFKYFRDDVFWATLISALVLNWLALSEVSSEDQRILIIAAGVVFFYPGMLLSAYLRYKRFQKK